MFCACYLNTDFYFVLLAQNFLLSKIKMIINFTTTIIFTIITITNFTIAAAVNLKRQMDSSKELTLTNYPSSNSLFYSDKNSFKIIAVIIHSVFIYN